jgi:isoleucyl-tRNA synthetase
MGPKIGKEVNTLEKEIKNIKPLKILRDLNQKGQFKLNDYSLEFKDLNIRVAAEGGYAAAEESGYIAVLDTTITESLSLEGAAREIIRHIQNQRQKLNFDVADRIIISYKNNVLLNKVLDSHKKFITDETLAIEIVEINDVQEVFNFIVNDEAIELSVRKNEN